MPRRYRAIIDDYAGKWRLQDIDTILSLRYFRNIVFYIFLILLCFFFFFSKDETE